MAKHWFTILVYVVGGIAIVVLLWYLNYYVPSLSLDQTTTIRYENRGCQDGTDATRSIMVEGELRDRIMSVLSRPPDGYFRGGILLETGEAIYISPGNERIQIVRDELILMDSRGVHSWKMSGIEMELENLLNANR